MTDIKYYVTSGVPKQLRDVDAQQIKLLYESNVDTNAFTDALLAYLNSLIAGESENYYTKDQVENIANFNLTIRALTSGGVFYYDGLDTTSITLVCVDTQQGDIDSKVYTSIGALEAATPITFFTEADINAIVDDVAQTITFTTTDFDLNPDRFNLYIYIHFTTIDGGEF
jgi:hypothetical protein